MPLGRGCLLLLGGYLLLPAAGAGPRWCAAREQPALLQSWASSRRAVFEAPSGDATTLTLRNSCPFAVKAIDGGGSSWNIVTLAQGEQVDMATASCAGACRTYFAPDSWSGTPGPYSMGPVEPMGFFEYTKTSDGTLSPDLSYIGGIGIPMTLQCEGAPLYGCTDGGYGGWEEFQSRLRAYCPGRVQTFEGSSVSYCDPGQYGGVADLPFGRKWDVQGSFQDAGTSMSRPDPQSLATCQPWSEGHACAHVARGTPECAHEDTCDGEQLFYQGYDMRDVEGAGAWRFNGFAAFVHTICGVYSGFAFAADDRGAGVRNGTRMKYASNMGFGCSRPAIELCPPASTAFAASGGYTYPPPAGRPAGAVPPAPAATPAPPAAPTTAPTASPIAAPAGSSPAEGGWERHELNCYVGNGAGYVPLPGAVGAGDSAHVPGLSLQQCRELCLSTGGCTAITMSVSGGRCFGRQGVELDRCAPGGGYFTEVHRVAAGPTPSPPAATPPPPSPSPPAVAGGPFPITIRNTLPSSVSANPCVLYGGNSLKIFTPSGQQVVIPPGASETLTDDWANSGGVGIQINNWYWSFSAPTASAVVSSFGPKNPDNSGVNFRLGADCVASAFENPWQCCGVRTDFVSNVTVGRDAQGACAVWVAANAWTNAVTPDCCSYGVMGPDSACSEVPTLGHGLRTATGQVAWPAEWLAAAPTWPESVPVPTLAPAQPPAPSAVPTPAATPAPTAAPTLAPTAPTVAPTAAPIASCHTAVPGEECYGHAAWAHGDGIRQFPQWYPGLSEESSLEDFQRHLWRRGLGECPEPCAPASPPTPGATPPPSPSPTPPPTPSPTPSPTASPTVPTPCYTAVPGDECYGHAAWAHQDGIRSFPQWYPGLSPESSLEDFQDHLWAKGLYGCARPCRR